MWSQCLLTLIFVHHFMLATYRTNNNYHYSQHLTLLFLLLVRVPVLDVLPCFAFTVTLSDNHMVVRMMERYPYITYHVNHLALTVACTCC